MEIANVIVSGVRIYLPPDNVLPKPSTDMLTFAVVKDPGLISDYLLMVHRNGRWICPYISRHLLSLNPLLARCRRYSRGER